MSEIVLAVMAMGFLAPVMQLTVNILASYHDVKQGDYLVSKTWCCNFYTM